MSRLKCENKHHTSICHKLHDFELHRFEPILVTTETNVTYPVAIIKVNGVKFRALLDTGSSNLYMSEPFIDLLKIPPVRKEYKTIERLTNSVHKKLKIYNVKVENLDKRILVSKRS